MTDQSRVGAHQHGSDWPVCLVAAPYSRIVETAEALTAGLRGAERDRFFGGTARQVYRLDALPITE